jgi:tetratricopeptide (TPR) repeat protein
VTLVSAPSVVRGQGDQAAEVEARNHFQRGKAAFELGQFRKALAHYENAYRLMALPGFLFNIGQCYRNLDDYDKAIHAFRTYLRQAPEAANREAVERLLADLEQKRKAHPRSLADDPLIFDPKVQQPTTAPSAPVAGSANAVRDPAPPQPPAADRSSDRPFYRTWWFWTVIAAAVGGGVTGVYFATRKGDSSLPSSPFPVWDLSR